jgi:hypothetical protein
MRRFRRIEQMEEALFSDPLQWKCLKEEEEDIMRNYVTYTMHIMQRMHNNELIFTMTLVV